MIIIISGEYRGHDSQLGYEPMMERETQGTVGERGKEESVRRCVFPTGLVSPLMTWHSRATWLASHVRPTSTCGPPPTASELSQRAGVINIRGEAQILRPFSLPIGQSRPYALPGGVQSCGAPRFVWEAEKLSLFLLGILRVVRCTQWRAGFF